jgi:hypothetical protein
MLYKHNYQGARLCDPYWDAVWDPDALHDGVHEEFYDLTADPQVGKKLAVARAVSSTVGCRQKYYEQHHGANAANTSAVDFRSLSA